MLQSVWSQLRCVAVYAVALAALGCASHSRRTEEARSALDAARPELALKLLNKELKVKSAEELPEKVAGKNTVLILDRAMVLQMLGEYELSSRDLEAADKALEVLDFSRNTLDDIAKYTFSDSSGPYKAPAYEKLMVNTMNMVNYLQRGDLNGARVEARRLAVMQKYLKEHEDPSFAMLGPGSYFAGFAFEKSGKPQEALRYYDEALQYGNYVTLREPVTRLSQRASYSSPRLERLMKGLDPTKKSKPKASQLDQPWTESSKPLTFALGDAWIHIAPTSAKEGDEQKPSTGNFEQAAADAAADPGAATSGAAKGKGEGGNPAQPKDGSDGPTTKTDGSDADATKADGADADATKANGTDVAATKANRRDMPATKADGKGELLVVVSFGRVPPKIPRRIPIGLALTYASGALAPADVRKANELALQGLVTWVNFPDMGEPEGTWEQPDFYLSSRRQPLEGLIALDQEAYRAFEEIKGSIVASAITRMLTRVVAGQAAKKAGGNDSALGLLLSLGTQAALTAADTPDTRSWATLPARIAVGRVRLEPGKYEVVLNASGYERRQTIAIRPGGWATATLTALR